MNSEPKTQNSEPLPSLLDWAGIDTVLLDMDGTLLDLHFDNYFWMTHLPHRYAEQNNLCPHQVSQQLHARYDTMRGTLNWYCLEYWSRELNMDIRQLKEEVQHLINERPHVQEFLSQLGQQGKKRILITNAHPQALELKLAVTGISAGLDQIISSHSYKAPKESAAFWAQLSQQVLYNPERTLFIDDSEPVLTAAENHGIKHLLSIHQPDSRQPAKTRPRFATIQHFDEIFPEPRERPAR